MKWSCSKEHHTNFLSNEYRPISRLREKKPSSETHPHINLKLVETSPSYCHLKNTATIILPEMAHRPRHRASCIVHRVASSAGDQHKRTPCCCRPSLAAIVVIVVIGRKAGRCLDGSLLLPTQHTNMFMYRIERQHVVPLPVSIARPITTTTPITIIEIGLSLTQRNRP